MGRLKNYTVISGQHFPSLVLLMNQSVYLMCKFKFLECSECKPVEQLILCNIISQGIGWSKSMHDSIFII